MMTELVKALGYRQVLAGILAVFVGFASSFAIVLSGSSVDGCDAGSNRHRARRSDDCGRAVQHLLGLAVAHTGSTGLVDAGADYS